jgi:hypothetical protein
MDDFKGPKEMANYLANLMEDHDEYLKYFRYNTAFVCLFQAKFSNSGGENTVGLL